MLMAEVVRIKGKDYKLPKLPKIAFPETGLEENRVVAVSNMPGTDNVLIFSLSKGGRQEEVAVYEARQAGGELRISRKVGGFMAAKDVDGRYNVYFLKVDPELRRKGIGETLVSIARRRAIENNARRIEFPEHAEHEEFYKKKGFRLKKDWWHVYHEARPEKVRPGTRLKFFLAGVRHKRKK